MSDHTEKTGRPEQTGDTEKTGDSGSDRTSRIVAKLFDIRSIIGALMAIYGVILLIGGLLPATAEAGAGDRPPSSNPVDMSVGTGANIWVGVILVAVGALFLVWAALRPTDR